MSKIVNYFETVGRKRFLLMIVGNIILGMGVAIFRLSTMGNDPFNGMNMAVSAYIGISYPLYQVLVNIALFIFQIFAGRKLIGAGTIVNAVFLGYLVSFFYHLMLGIGQPHTIPARVVTVLAGVVVCSLGLSFYQRSNAGVAPYDALALIMDRKFTKISYFWCRIITDACCAVVCFLFGGIIGLGTLVSTFGLGPFVQFFDKTITMKILKETDNKKEM